MAERHETSVVVVEFESGEFYLISSLSTSRDTQVIGVDPTTGALAFSGRRGIDVFQAEVDALQYLTGNSRWLPKSTLYGKAILGYAALGNVGVLLIATKLRTSIANLPGGDSVYTVVESKWVKIPLRNPQPLLKAEVKNASDLTDIVIDKVHFFCETRDVTRPFPSQYSVQSPDEEFAWNSWLSIPFKSIGLPRHCVVLLQGLADSRTFTDFEGRQLTVAVTARRSRLHPGTRYLARGLNAAFSTGNEVECEQLVWPHVAPGQPVPFALYLWRRGTVPLWWGAEIKSNIAEAEIFVSENRTYEGSAQYYKRLSQRYGSKAPKSGEKSKKPPIVCINLLRNGLGKPEVVLWQHFQDSLKYVRSQGEVNDARIFILNYDWHDKMKAIGESKTVEGLWQLLKDPTSDIKFDTGEYYAKGQQPKNFPGSLTPNRGLYGGVFRVTKKQEGVIRFNCADSLDRTNAASFFGAVQVLAEQCRQLGYPLDTGKGSPTGFGNGNTEGSEGPLPAGWERRVDAVTGRVFYIDHNTRKTTWEHPCPQNTTLDKPWTRFDMSVDEFREATIPGAIAGMAEISMIAGDIHATLYTGSKAMHSHIIQIFSEEGGKAKTLSPAQNLAITLQRRFLNVLMDSTRQKQLEMFVGLRLNKYFPSLPDQPLQVLTRPHACLLKPVPSMFPNAIPANSLISAKYKDTVWVCPSAAEVVEPYILLAEPCHVAQLLITVAHGADDLTSPALFDVRAGRHVDSLKLVLEGATIPRCSNGTQLLYVVPGARNAEDVAITGAGAGGNDFSWLYNFEEQEGELDFLTRIVVLTLYPASPGIPVTLGEVEVLGVSLFSGKIYSSLEQQRPGSDVSSSSWRDSLTPEKTPLNFMSNSLKGVTPTRNPSFTQSQVTPTSSPSLVSTGFDLLGDTLLHSPSQGVSSSGVGGPLVPDLLSWDPFETASVGSSSPASSHTLAGQPSTAQQQSRNQSVLDSASEVKGPAEQYVRSLEKILDTNLGRPVNFKEATELEITRLSVGLSAAERDRALLSIGRDPATLDPNRLLKPLHLVQVRQAASQLALATQIAAEDKASAAIGLESQEQSTSDGEENEVIQECCSHPDCEVVMRKKMTGFGKTSVLVICDNCKKRTCVACKAGDESSMLASLGGNMAGPSGASSSAGLGRGLPPLNITICRKCCPDVIQDAALLDRVRVLATIRRKMRVQAALHKALAEAASLGLLTERYRILGSTNGGNGGDGMQSLYKGLTSLAESPYASLLSSVPSAEDAEPAESLIANPRAGSPTTYWRLPPGVANVDITIVLSAPSMVSGIILVVSPCGFTPQGAPLIDMWCSNTVAETDRVSLGRWDISAAASSAAENIYGPEPPRPVSAAPRHVLFKLKSPTRCRMIWFRISLPSAVGISYDLLGSPPRGGSLPVFIHAKRILVLGRSTTDDTESTPSSQGPDRINLRSALDAPARTVRLKVQIEGERSAAGGRMIQLFISPMAPSISGFRFDALAAVRTAARYMVSASYKMRAIDEALGSCIDEAVTNPVALQISVAAVQGENQAAVPAGNYLLPITRPGTPLYYDFGQPISARVLVFELLGDVSAFAEEPTDQGDTSDGREAILPASLSLANKIRPYTQVNAAELGKWPQLNAI